MHGLTPRGQEKVTEPFLWALLGIQLQILDEVLNLPANAQQLLLDFTQFGSYRPLGYDGAQPRSATVRIIAATNKRLENEVNAGNFREDLFYRLNVVPSHVPSLRERPEDIAPNLEHELDRAGGRLGLRVTMNAAARARFPHLTQFIHEGAAVFVLSGHG